MSIEGEFVRFTSRARNPLAFVRDSIDAGYLDDIHRFEVLEKDHEYEFAKRWRERGDRDAAHQLVTSHLRLAVKPPSATAAMVCLFRKSSPKATSA